MKKLLLAALFMYSAASAQDTFSIVVIDSVTGQIGSAGASCLGVVIPIAPRGAQAISDIIPGRGAIHSQAYLNTANQQNARARMLAGESPQQIIAWLIANDAQNNSTIRQYGIVDFNNGTPRSAAFTGINCNDYKNHITGSNYSIQGNILLGQQILDSMESSFLNSSGTLADRLMASLQSVNITGADTRCFPSGTSSLSSFIRVALPTDTIGKYYLDLYMSYPNNTSVIYPVDPIDSLQTLYDIWLSSLSAPKIYSSDDPLKVYKNVQGHFIFDLSHIKEANDMRITIYDVLGKQIWTESTNEKTLVFVPGQIAHGLLIYHITSAHLNVAGKIVN